jgi:hypothetical protein
MRNELCFSHTPQPTSERSERPTTSPMTDATKNLSSFAISCVTNRVVSRTYLIYAHLPSFFDSCVTRLYHQPTPFLQPTTHKRANRAPFLRILRHPPPIVPLTDAFPTTYDLQASQASVLRPSLDEPSESQYPSSKRCPSVPCANQGGRTQHMRANERDLKRRAFLQNEPKIGQPLLPATTTSNLPYEPSPKSGHSLRSKVDND